MTRELWFSSEIYRNLHRICEEEAKDMVSIANKAIQSILTIHAYTREGKIFVARDPLTKNIHIEWVIEIPQSLDEKEGRDQCLRVYCSDKVYEGLVRTAGEMGCSVSDVLCKGVALYETIHEHRSHGRTFGIITPSVELSTFYTGYTGDYDFTVPLG